MKIHKLLTNDGVWWATSQRDWQGIMTNENRNELKAGRGRLTERHDLDFFYLLFHCHGYGTQSVFCVDRNEGLQERATV